MEMTKGELLFDGNEKQLYATEDPQKVIILFKDVATAFNNIKTALFPGKGEVNNRISSLFFEYLGHNGIYTHFVKSVGPNEQLCRKSVSVIPLEFVVRNYVAGSFADRLALEEGGELRLPVYDINYNNSDLGDPLVNDSEAVALGLVSSDDLKIIYAVAAKVNLLLKDLCAKAGLKLVDFKLEFGYDCNGQIMVCDEISPDTSRFWDAQTDKRLDKDRFRHDLGYIVASYQEVLTRIEGALRKENTK